MIAGGKSPRLYAPLKDPELFISFAKLASRGRPSDKSILGWTHRYGLLKRIDGKPELPFVSSNTPNQAPMPIEDFKDEAMQAYSALNLHADLVQGNIGSLRKRLGKLREADKKLKPLSKIDKRLVEDWGHEVDGDTRGSSLPWMAEVALASFVTIQVEGVRLSLWGSGYWASSDGAYKPLTTWECPDLLSANYLQFYLLIADALPMRRCLIPSCRMPFPLTRKDRHTCSDTCRSNLRHYPELQNRRRTKSGPDTNRDNT